MELRGLSRGAALLLALSLIRLGWERLQGPAPLLDPSSSEAPALLDASREALAQEAERTRPLTPGEKVDPNRSGEETLDRLPGIGPGVARALILDREERGAFTRPEDLLRVRGIGAATLAKIRPHLDFSSPLPMELGRGPGRSAASPRRELPLLTRGTSVTGTQGDQAQRLDVNRATTEELEGLPGIGPALARRIVESREREGLFRTPEDLLRVPGIGPATLARIRGRISPQD